MDGRVTRLAPLAFVCAVLLLLLTACVAKADEMFLPAGADLIFGLLATGLAVAAFLGLIAATIAVEAWVLCASLGLKRDEGITYSLWANLASGLVGAVWWLMGGEMGWKTAVLGHHWGIAGMSVVRSYLVTLAVETAVLVLLLRHYPDTKKVLRASALANAASYVLVSVLVVLAATYPRAGASHAALAPPAAAAALSAVEMRHVPASLTGLAVAGVAPVILAARDTPGSLTLSHAVRGGDLADVGRHLKAGADPNARDEFGATPLHWAAAGGHARVAALLLAHGADPDARARDGETPLQVARSTGHHEVAALLEGRTGAAE